MRVIGIDPGPTEVHYAVWDTETMRVVESGSEKWAHCGHAGAEPEFLYDDYDVAAVEVPAVRGHIYPAVLDTAVIAGSVATSLTADVAMTVKPSDWLLEVTGKRNGKNVRACLIERLGEPGTKRDPGPTYGVTGHSWDALGVAVWAWEQVRAGG